MVSRFKFPYSLICSALLLHVVVLFWEIVETLRGGAYVEEIVDRDNILVISSFWLLPFPSSTSCLR
jgi:hypothetical protein